MYCFGQGLSERRDLSMGYGSFSRLCRSRYTVRVYGNVSNNRSVSGTTLTIFCLLRCIQFSFLASFCLFFPFLCFASSLDFPFSFRSIRRTQNTSTYKITDRTGDDSEKTSHSFFLFEWKKTVLNCHPNRRQKEDRAHVSRDYI